MEITRDKADTKIPASTVPIKGQCKEILECCFLHQLLLLVPFEVLWDDFNICRIFSGDIQRNISLAVYHTPRNDDSGQLLNK